MDEKNMIPIKEEKEKKVEIIKDLNSVTDSEKELDAQKEQERKERIFLIQLIVVFVVWVFLIIMVMKDERLPPKNAPKPQAKPPVQIKPNQIPKPQANIPPQNVDKNKPTPVAAQNTPSANNQKK